MKKNLIYILVGLLMFMGFNDIVKADSSCIYQKVEQNSAGKESDFTEGKSAIVLSSDGLNHLNSCYFSSYSSGAVCDSKTNNGSKRISIAKTDLLKSKEGKDLMFGFGELFLYGSALEKIKQNSATITSEATCPNYVVLSVAFGNKFCYTDDYNSATTSCLDSMKLNRRGYVVFKKSDFTTNNLSEDTKQCVIEPAVESEDSGGAFCKVVVYYDKKTKTAKMRRMYGESGTEFSEVTSDSITCLNEERGKGETLRDKKYKLYFSNTTAGLHDSSVMVKDLNKFNSKFLKEWQQNNWTCPKMTFAKKKNNSDTEITHYVLFEDAAADIEKYGNDVLNMGSIREIKEYNTEFPDLFDNEQTTCEGLLSPKIREFISDIMSYIKILIPILLIGLGVSDFLKAVLSTKEDAMKKTQVTFIKRLIAAVVIFFIPALINVIINALDGIWAYVNNNTCSIDIFK